MSAVLATTAWPSNAELIADCAALGYLRDEWRTLDPTFGQGTFWKLWQPNELVTHDIRTDGVDFTDLPHRDHSFAAVVFDPPYKLNGTDQGEGERYGVHEPADWRERMDLMCAGLSECARVLGAGYLLVKCQDQVCSGKVRWQTDIITRRAEAHGLGKVDRLDLLNYRPQPHGRRQVHARRNSSTLLVFKRGWYSA